MVVFSFFEKKKKMLILKKKKINGSVFEQLEQQCVTHTFSAEVSHIGLFQMYKKRDNITTLLPTKKASLRIFFYIQVYSLRM